MVYKGDIVLLFSDFKVYRVLYIGILWIDLINISTNLTFVVPNRPNIFVSLNSKLAKILYE
jgi:hypothetical protein